MEHTVLSLAAERGPLWGKMRFKGKIQSNFSGFCRSISRRMLFRGFVIFLEDGHKRYFDSPFSE